MVLVGAAILPHGPLSLDGDAASPSEAGRARHARLTPDLRPKFKDLYEGCCRTASTIASWEPDVVILSTPHGFTLTHSVGVYLASGAEGGAAWQGTWSEFRVNVELDTEIAAQLLGHFRKEGVPAEGVLAHDGLAGVDTLRWGEAVPLWYILKAVKKKPKFVILSQYTQETLGVDIQIEEQRLETGRSLARFLGSHVTTDVKVAVVISGDLSHAYATDCQDPLYLLDFSNFISGMSMKNNIALKLERAARGWVSSLDSLSSLDSETPLEPERPLWNAKDAFPWLLKLSDLNPTAYSCGASGFIMLHAMMEWVSQKNSGCHRRGFKPKIETCQAPTYYGMMAATFQRVSALEG